MNRRTPLRPGRPPRRKSCLRQRRSRPRRSPYPPDPARLAWLRTRPCRVPGCTARAECHHARHDAHGAALGARVKDDRRAISLCRCHHQMLHQAPWQLRLIVQLELRAWVDLQIEAQQAEYLAHQQGDDHVA